MSDTDTPSGRLAALGIALPPLAVPAAAYVPFVRTGNLVFVSGHTHSAEVLDGLGPLVRKPYAGEALVRAIAAALQP